MNSLVLALALTAPPHPACAECQALAKPVAVQPAAAVGPTQAPPAGPSVVRERFRYAARGGRALAPARAAARLATAPLRVLFGGCR